MPRSDKFHPIWRVAALEAGYLRIIVVAAAIGFVTGASTTSTLLEESPEGSFRNIGRSDNDAWQYLTSPSIEPESRVKAPLTNSAPVPTQGLPSAALPESQKSGNVLEEQSGKEQQPEPQATINGQTNSEQHCNVAVCGQLYQSFRLSDCTYQPYSGPRRYCER